jgi:hypothetical protein
LFTTYLIDLHKRLPANGLLKNAMPDPFMKIRTAFLVFFLSVLPRYTLLAQDIKGGKIQVVGNYLREAFPLVHAGQAAPVFIDASDAEVVGLAAAAFSQDVARVTGIKPSVSKSSTWKEVARYPVLIGTRSSLAPGPH